MPGEVALWFILLLVSGVVMGLAIRRKGGGHPPRRRLRCTACRHEDDDEAFGDRIKCPRCGSAKVLSGPAPAPDGRNSA